MDYATGRVWMHLFVTSARLQRKETTSTRDLWNTEAEFLTVHSAL